MPEHAPGDSTVFDLNSESRSDHPPHQDASNESPLGSRMALGGVSLADGRFEILKTLGRGGFAVVHRAFDHQLKREVALKIPHFHVVGDRSAKQWLTREALATAALTHESIVRLYDFRIDQDACYLVSELIEGKTLAEFIKANPQGMPARTAVEIVLPIAEALAHAHSIGVLHRDVKPSNILLDYRLPTETLPGTPRLADFGLASVPTQESFSATGQNLVGSIQYLPPEVIGSASLNPTAGKKASLEPFDIQPTHTEDQPLVHELRPGQNACSSFTCQGDVYALSLVLYELLTGQQAFSGNSIAQIVHRVVQGEPPPIRKLRRDIPKDLEAIVLQGMAGSPAKRYASASLFAADLKRYCNGQAVLARHPTFLESLARQARRRPAAATAVGLSALAFLGFATIILWNNRLLERLNRTLASQNVSLETALAEAEQARFENEQIIYSLDMVAADTSVKQGDLRKAQSILQRYDSDQRLVQHRDIEWNLLNQQIQRKSRVLFQSTAALYVGLYSSNGQWLVVGGKDAKITFTDSQSGEILRQWDSQQIELNAVVLSSDESVLWTTGDDGTVRAWKTATGEQMWSCQAFQPSIRAYDLVHLPVIDRLIVRGDDESLVAIDTSNGNTVEEAATPPGRHWSLQSRGDGKTFLTGGDEGELRIVDGQSMQVVSTLYLVDGKPTSRLLTEKIVLSPDGRWAALGARGNQLFLLDLQLGITVDQQILTDEPLNMTFVSHPSTGTNTKPFYLLVAARHGTFLEFHFTEDHKLASRESWITSSGRIFGLVVNSIRNQVAALTGNGTAEQWTLSHSHASMATPMPNGFTSFLLMDTPQLPVNDRQQASAESLLLILANSLQLVCVSTKANSRTISIAPHASQFELVDVGSLGLWVQESPELVHRLDWKILSDAVESASGEQDSLELPWQRLELPRRADKIRTAAMGSNHLAVSNDAQWISGYDSQQRQVWHYNTLQPDQLHAFKLKDAHGALLVCEKPTNRFWWSDFNKIYHWTAGSSQPPSLVLEMPTVMELMAFSADYRYLALFSAGNHCAVWDIQQERQVAQHLFASRPAISSCVFSPSNRTLMLLDNGGGFSCWNLSSGRQTYHRAGSAVADIPTHRCFSSNGRYVALFNATDWHWTIQQLY